MTVKDAGAEPPLGGRGGGGPLPLSTVLLEEYRALHGRDEGYPALEEQVLRGFPEVVDEGAGRREVEDARLKIVYAAIHSLRARRSALCLSGGGIRSATFCLGVIQGLARRKLLGNFDYLSTVSGGGYIGSWLSAWIHRAGRPGVIEALGAHPKSALSPEPGEISHLRSYSNYLSPKLGFLSVDTWTLVAIYLRNLFLNWLVFVPLLLAVLMIPRMYVALIQRNFGLEVSDFVDFGVRPEHQGSALLALGLLFGSVGLAYIGSHRPSLRPPRRAPDAGRADPDNLRNFLLWCMTPLATSVLLLTTGRSWYLSSKGASTWTLPQFISGGALLHALSWVITFFFVLRRFDRGVFWRYLRNPKRLIEFVTVTVTGALGGAFLWLLSIPEKIYWEQYRPQKYPELYASFDGPQLMLVFLLMGVLAVGLGRNSVADEDREWWARAGAWVLIAITVWAALNSLVLFGPRLFDTLSTLPDTLSRSLLSLGVVSGLVTILFGLSSKTPANDRQAEKAGRLTTVMDYGVKAAAPVFALFLIVALSTFTDLLIRLTKSLPDVWMLSSAGEWCRYWFGGCPGGVPPPLPPHFTTAGHRDVILNSSFLFLLGTFAVMVGIAFLMAWHIDINQYSLHSLYRNRLVRAYLGASRRRRPNSFTGFDPHDDIPMAKLWPGGGGGEGARHAEAGKPLHVVNMTWNLVQGKNLAWQNRKATTFTVSPLHCGSLHYGYRPSEEYGGEYPDSISLGTAFTISGAAASPNMGYYSSAAVTFLMTLFNARLGWWLGNPAKGEYRKRGPEWALRPMLDEAFGKTEDDKDYVYLSDGGHFENLGLYEMVVRRCHYIFVVDASRDPDHKFENLGNAIRRIRVDLGVDIEIRDIGNYPKTRDTPGAYCAVGDIRYKEVDGAGGAGAVEDGLLVYIKPALTGEEPTDIFNYAQANLEFPHESTGDQFFSEQQFESYRALGLYAVEQIFQAPPGGDFSRLRGDIEEYVRRSRGVK